MKLSRIALVALVAVAPAFAANSMVESYSLKTLNFGYKEENRVAMKNLLGQIADQSKGAISFETSEDFVPASRFGFALNGEKRLLNVKATVTSGDSMPAQGESMTQSGLADSIDAAATVASIESTNGKNDPAVSYCQEMAKKLNELSKKGEFKVSAACEITENSRKATVAGEPIKVTTEVACAEQAQAQAPAQSQGQAQAPAQAIAQGQSQAQATAQGQSQAQGQAQVGQAQAKPAPVKMCKKTELQPTTKEIVLISHGATIKYSFSPERVISTPVEQKPAQQAQAPAQQAQAPAAQQAQANPAAQVVGQAQVGQTGQTSQAGQN